MFSSMRPDVLPRKVQGVAFLSPALSMPHGLDRFQEHRLPSPRSLSLKLEARLFVLKINIL